MCEVETGPLPPKLSCTKVKALLTHKFKQKFKALIPKFKALTQKWLLCTTYKALQKQLSQSGALAPYVSQSAQQ